ncbi:MAG: hypothetical protein KGI19_11180 [Thaumarchaeota archaeon]|nr:hypothetical protein [Nitrososphaerota archaeon]
MDTVVADKGYDSEWNRVVAHRIGIANTVIRPKYENLQVYRTKGINRKRMKCNFDWDTYHQRSKIETIFSVIKRMLGEYNHVKRYSDTKQGDNVSHDSIQLLPIN